jgi:hypothetical protein
MAYSGGMFANAGDSQYSLYVLRGSTTGTNSSYLYLNGSSLQIALKANESCSFTIRVVGRDHSGETCALYTSGGAQNSGGPVTVSQGPVGNWVDNFPPSTVTVTSTGPNLLSIQVTAGGASSGDTIHWTATVETAEVCF